MKTLKKLFSAVPSSEIFIFFWIDRIRRYKADQSVVKLIGGDGSGWELSPMVLQTLVDWSQGRMIVLVVERGDYAGATRGYSRGSGCATFMIFLVLLTLWRRGSRGGPVLGGRKRRDVRIDVAHSSLMALSSR